MKSSIRITESNPFNDEIRIQGAVSEPEAQDAAAEWCDENNCILIIFYLFMSAKVFFTFFFLGY